MPKQRKKTGKRQVQEKVYIFCEGSKDKSEYSYLKPLIDSLEIPGKLIEIINTKKNTGKELVKEAKEIRRLETDTLWVVYDKDGYTKHPDTFNHAENAGINIAFSAISFETWILLHFEYTSKPYEKSEDVIQHIKRAHGFEYEKYLDNTFKFLEDKIQVACQNARRLRQEQESNVSGETKIYEINPYTNIDELIECLFAKQAQYKPS